jgi:hypothetical protein
MRNVPDECCRENQNTLLPSITSFLMMPFIRQRGKNIVEPGRQQMTTWRMLIACWIPKATNTHSSYVILTVFPL